ncbi:MAG: type II toxin-antitoxin system VapC family toxin [bacterium]
MIVVDTNVPAARNLTGTKPDLAKQVEQIDPVWILPQLWRYEVQNILATAVRVRQITPDNAMAIWQDVSSRMSTNEHDASSERVIELFTRHKITAYDANFIALAMEMKVFCVTEDTELQEKFPDKALSMAEFVRLSQAKTQVRETHAMYRVRRKR